MVYDALGREVEVGDWVTYAVSSPIIMKMGQVVRTTPKMAVVRVLRDQGTGEYTLLRTPKRTGVSFLKVEIPDPRDISDQE